MVAILVLESIAIFFCKFQFVNRYKMYGQCLKDERVIMVLNAQHNTPAHSQKIAYCKTLIIPVTLFSRGHHRGYIHENLFSRFVISCSIILPLEIIGEDFIFASLCSREFTRK